MLNIGFLTGLPAAPVRGCEPGQLHEGRTAVPRKPGTSDYVVVRRFKYILSPATPDDLCEVRRLIRETVRWLGRSKNTDQWARPWPDRPGQRKRMLSDLLAGKTWLVWDDGIVAGTITLDTEEPLTAHGHPVWPTHKRHDLALYVRRVIVSRGYAGLGIGAGLLDWAAEVAKKQYGATLIRIDVWTTNSGLHAYYEGQRFRRCPGRAPWELVNYPSQALYEREIDQAGAAHKKLFVEAENPNERQPRWHMHVDRSR
jgi:GNAT superfamily N-acetyltransferase